MIHHVLSLSTDPPHPTSRNHNILLVPPLFPKMNKSSTLRCDGKHYESLNLLGLKLGQIGVCERHPNDVLRNFSSFRIFLDQFEQALDSVAVKPEVFNYDRLQVVYNWAKNDDGRLYLGGMIIHRYDVEKTTTRGRAKSYLLNYLNLQNLLTIELARIFPSFLFKPLVALSFRRHVGWDSFCDFPFLLARIRSHMLDIEVHSLVHRGPFGKEDCSFEA